MVDPIKTTFSASANAVVVKPQVTVRIDRPVVSVSKVAPVRESKPVEVSPKAEVRSAVVELGVRAAASRPSVLPMSNSALATYRDQESGRVIIRVFDRESGDILVELPPETQRSAIGPPDPPPLLGTRTKVEA